MGERAHVFLSYRNAEVDFALRLGADLKNAGVNLWMDRFDIQPGEDWKRTLQGALTNSAAIIPILSPAYLASTYCRHELTRISRMGRPIIPVVFRPVFDAEWLLEIEQEPYIDFSLSQDVLFYQNQLGKLIDSLHENVPDQVHESPDANTQYVHNLMAKIETNKGLISRFEASTVYEESQENLDVRPQPIVGQTWFLHGRYALIGTRAEKENVLLEQLTPLNGIYDAVDNLPCFVLIGPPGIGKSLTVQSLALDALRQYRLSPMTAPLPLLIELHHWAEHSNPLEMIRSHWSLPADPIELLAKGRVSLYLDGLSEFSHHEHAAEKVTMLWEWFNSRFAPQHVVITCRSEASEQGKSLGLPVVQMLDLDATYIQRFAEYYLQEDEAKFFLSQMVESPTTSAQSATLLYGMARNLFLLAALVLMYRTSSEREITYSAGSLISKLVSALLDNQHQQNITDEPTTEQIEAVLVDLAFSMVDAEVNIYVPHETAIQFVGNPALLNAAVNANLLEVDRGEFRFPHDLLKHYYAAHGLQYEGLPTRLTRPEFDSNFQRLPKKWDPIITMLVGIVPYPDAVILNIAEVDPYLALQCIFCGVHLEDRTYKTVVKQQLDMMKTDGDYRVAMAQILIGPDDKKATLILLEVLRDGGWVVRQAASSAFKRIKLQPLPAVVEAIDTLEDATREETLAALCLLGKDALPTLMYLLRVPQWHLRRGAAWALGELKEKAAVPFLLETLQDSDHAVSAEVALSLGQIKDVIAIPNLVRMLAHPHWRVSRAASKSLAYMGDAAVHDLIEVLRNRNSPTGQRVRTIEALAHIKHTDAAIAVLKMTRSRNVEERYTAVKALKNHMTQAAARRLVECLSDDSKPRWSNQRVCDLAATILETVDSAELKAVVEKWRQRQLRNARSAMNEPSGKRVKERLRRVVQSDSGTDGNFSAAQTVDDEDWIERSDAVTALSAEDAAIAIPRLLTVVASDEEGQVRASAIKSLAKFKDDERLLPALFQALYDEEFLVSDAARDTIKLVGQPPVPALLDAIQSDNLSVRAAAIDIAGAVGEQDAVPFLMESLTDIRTLWLSDQRMCDIAVRALEAIGTPESLEAADQWRKAQSTPLRQSISVPENVDKSRDILNELMEGLHNEDWVVRQEAAKSLRDYAQFSRGIPDSLFVQPLTTALSDPDWIVRWAATEALAWIRDSAPVAALAVLIDDPNWMVRSAAVRALMEIGDPTSVDSLLHGLSDTNAMVREAAAEALGTLQDSRAISGLSMVLADSEQLVQLAAIKSLGLIQDPLAVEYLNAQLYESDTVIRWYVAEALRKISHPDAVPALISLLGDESHPHWEEKRVCDVAASALEAINTQEARAALEEWQLNQAIH